MFEHLPLLVYAALIGWPALMFLDGIRKKRRLDAARRNARQAFDNARVESTDPTLVFNGRTATIVKVEEPANPYREPTAWFTLTIFARNEFGEYFVFKSTRPKPFIKHMPHSLARQVLKADYVPRAEA